MEHSFIPDLIKSETDLFPCYVEVPPTPLFKLMGTQKGNFVCGFSQNVYIFDWAEEQLLAIFFFSIS